MCKLTLKYAVRGSSVKFARHVEVVAFFLSLTSTFFRLICTDMCMELHLIKQFAFSIALCPRQCDVIILCCPEYSSYWWGIYETNTRIQIKIFHEIVFDLSVVVTPPPRIQLVEKCIMWS